MKNPIYLTIATGLALGTLLLAGIAEAGGPLRHRQRNQRARIHQGVQNGSVTRVERKVLKHEQRHVNQMRNRALANDGKVGPKEAKRIWRAQNRAVATSIGPSTTGGTRRRQLTEFFHGAPGCRL